MHRYELSCNLLLVNHLKKIHESSYIYIYIWVGHKIYNICSTSMILYLHKSFVNKIFSFTLYIYLVECTSYNYSLLYKHNKDYKTFSPHPNLFLSLGQSFDQGSHINFHLHCNYEITTIELPIYSFVIHCYNVPTITSWHTIGESQRLHSHI
jgi:hypothetical protein